MNLVRKLLCADECRKSHFHDEKGNLVSAPNLLLNGPRAFLTFALNSLINFRSEVPREKLLFGFIVIDEVMRSRCLKNALSRLRPGGSVYLDNSDKDSKPEGGDMRLAEKFLTEEVLKRNSWCKVFTDFAVAQLTPNQGMLAMLP